MKVLNRIMIFLFILVDSGYIYFKLSGGSTERLIIAAAVVPVLFGPWLIRKILRYEMSETLKFVYYLFTFCAMMLGSVLNFYNIPQFSGFDKLVHFISGLLTSLIALILLKKADLKNVPLWFRMSFIVFFSMAIAGIWEFYEFTCDQLLGMDTQQVRKSGITDTMWDMILAALASTLFSGYYWYQEKHAKKNKMKRLEQCL